MIKRILGSVFALIIVILIVMWFLGGGAHRAYQSSSKLSNPLSLFFGEGNGETFRLPWQTTLDLPNDPFGTTSPAETEGIASSDTTNSSGASPYASSAQLIQGQADKGLSDEYVEITFTGSAPITISGWSLESAYSHKRVSIPLAADPYVPGVINEVRPVVLLGNNEHAYIYSGPSPVGVSFVDSEGTWRLYLASGIELWRNTHDTIRLLDENKHVVDTLTY